MIYRKLGKTALEVSEIGLGCEGFMGKDLEQTRQLMDIAMNAGVNCMDLYSPNPDMRSNIGFALKGRRENFILQAHICSVWKNGQYKRTRALSEVKEGFADLLSRLQTDYIDIGMIHYVDAEKDWEEVSQGEVLQYAQELKATGKIRYIGMSSHNPSVSLKAVKSGMIDVLMFSINPCYDLLPATEDIEVLFDEHSYDKTLLNMDPEREALYEACQRLGVGITVMKAFGGGDLLNESLSPAGKALTPYQCLHYALTRPAVASVMVGTHTEEELKECLGYETAEAEQKDYAVALAALPKISWEGHCMYCGHCAPCPKGIDIASVTKFLNLAKAQGEIPETVREHYRILEHYASDCIGCGLCEKRCPFGVPVRENMQAAMTLFEK